VNSFILSSLENLNANYGSNFDTSLFRFQFFYDDAKSRVEIRLLSLREQTVTVCGQQVSFAAGEPVLLQVACKYKVEEFALLASEAGWRVDRVWTDPGQRFSIQYLESM
jgi:uncharacterized SAM-dependent methyltransferase